MTPTEQAVHELVLPIIEDLGVDVYDIELNSGTLRILLDRAGGIDMGSITEATRRISRSLDVEDPISSAYTLEVSSPGIERNLRTPVHFTGALGERVKVKTTPNSGLDRRLGGLLESFEDQVATIRTDDEEEVQVRLDQIERVRTEFVDTAAPKPGKGPGRSTKKNPKQSPSKNQSTTQTRSETTS